MGAGASCVWFNARCSEAIAGAAFGVWWSLWGDLVARIAVLGATSQLARDVCQNLGQESGMDLWLFSRRPSDVADWATGRIMSFQSLDYADFPRERYDALINFVGVGDPARAAQMGREILDITAHYDQMALEYCRRVRSCRYLFLSSGAVYGDTFHQPVTEKSMATLSINALSPASFYGAAKLYAEIGHRSHPDLEIIDIRVFNYISRSLDLSSRFLIADLIRALRDDAILTVSDQPMVRDYLHVQDFTALIRAALHASAGNMAVDCYSLAPIDKASLLALAQQRFGLRYCVTESAKTINATGQKPQYYSLNRQAENLGYRPSRSSAMGIEEEITAILTLSTSNTPLENGVGKKDIV
jgi:nucleoside-diphosphate-sugar epimerase